MDMNISGLYALIPEVSLSIYAALLLCHISETLKVINITRMKYGNWANSA